MKYLLGLFCLQWDRPNHTMYYEELLPRNVQNRILFFTGMGYYKTVQSEHSATFFQFFLINVIQILQCWSQIIIQARSEGIAIISAGRLVKLQSSWGFVWSSSQHPNDPCHVISQQDYLPENAVSSRHSVTTLCRYFFMLRHNGFFKLLKIFTCSVLV